MPSYNSYKILKIPGYIQYPAPLVPYPYKFAWGIPRAFKIGFIRVYPYLRPSLVSIKWSPGHTGIEGNEAADKLADLGALKSDWDAGLSSEPTVSGIRSIYRQHRHFAQQAWWEKVSPKLSKWYAKWGLDYKVGLPKELDLPRATLHRLLAIRSSHGDFAWYHRKFGMKTPI